MADTEKATVYPDGRLEYMPGPSLSMEVKQHGAAYVVLLSGDIDASSMAEFQSTVEPLCRDPSPHVILDCTDLNYVNSSGLGGFFVLSRMCKEHNGQLILCRVRSKIQNVMNVLGLEDLLVLRETQAEAFAMVAAN